MQSSIASWVVVFCACATSPDLTRALSPSMGGYGASSSAELGSLPDSFLREIMARMQGPDDDDLAGLGEPSLSRVAKEFGGHDGAQNFLGPALRDREYLQHNSLWGHQYVQGGAGEGLQRLKPDGSVRNLQSVKSDAVLPAYCNPPNPCPLGYTAANGCTEEFSNTAAFSREYQAAQDCMCDNEHMFDCPGQSQDSEIDALARSIQNEGLANSALDRIVQNMQIDGEHKTLVAKKFFIKKSQPSHPKAKRSVSGGVPLPRPDGPRKKHPGVKEANPYLMGERLPVVAKKAPLKPNTQ